MKRMIVAVLALVVLVLAVPVSAQSPAQDAINNVYETVNMPIRMMGQQNCDISSPGSPEWLSWCRGVRTDNYGRFTGYNPNSVAGQRARGYRADDLRRSRFYREHYGYGAYPAFGGYYGGMPYGYGYGPDIELNGRNIGAVLGGIGGGIATRNSRSGWVKAGGIVGGAVLGGILGNQVDRRGDRREAERYDRYSQYERRDREEERAEEETPEPTSQPAPSRTTIQAEKPTGTVYVSGGWLCNDTQNAIVVHVDGRPVGRLASGQMVEVTSLPQGKLGFKTLAQ